MIIYPAIDLIDGRCVRLRQGDFKRRTEYAMAPLQLAQAYARDGAEWLHVVDLDAARGRSDQLALIGELAGIGGLKVQCGGGVRRLNDVRRRLDTDSERIVVGSVCVQQTELFCQWLEAIDPDRLVAALDVRRVDERWLPAIAGWQQQGSEDLFTVLDRLVGAGLRHLLCTDISRDGTLGGPNLTLYRQILERYPKLQLQASGGVRSLADLHALRDLGAAGVVTGKALLEGRFRLCDALSKQAAVR